MNELTVFNFGSLPIRTYADENGESWFCLSDTCVALNIRQYRVDRLPQKGVTNCRTPTKGGNQELTFVNEPNLYRLVFRSNKPEAQNFADWVYSEVLPAIRKTGSYGMAKSASVLSLDEIRTAIKKSINQVLSEKVDIEQGWEVSDSDMIGYLHKWQLTKNKADTLKMQKLIAQNEEYKRLLNGIKGAVSGF